MSSSCANLAVYLYICESVQLPSALHMEAVSTTLQLFGVVVHYTPHYSLCAILKILLLLKLEVIAAL